MHTLHSITIRPDFKGIEISFLYSVLYSVELQLDPISRGLRSFNAKLYLRAIKILQLDPISRGLRLDLTPFSHKDKITIRPDFKGIEI